ncbi:DUF6779 domain-containing protein, partial [Mycolicibacterium sp.]|uniref:DUF6779 domain-containing protein n=1 Tax=Mycolicibacterium sp. TaxID=2320850 RepID=UPI001A2905B0
MTEPTRGTRARRGNRRPGSLLLTTLLVLAIVASSALVFTNKVELLKLAVIVALWAAVVAAFVSFIYRRQADLDHAKSRDLKLVYDLQLDREISARREYELAIESQLRRELASEMRAQTSDEVASLRAELAALRANLEIIFDTDLQSRPAIETERTTVHTFGDWDAAPQVAPTPERGERSSPGRVISSRLDTEAPEETDPNTEESPIIDVPVEPPPPEDDWAPQVPGGAHRRPSEPEPANTGWRPPRQEEPRTGGRRRAPEPESVGDAVPTPDVRLPWMPVDVPPPPPPPRREPEPVGRHAPSGSDWRPAPAEGLYIPAGAPGSNWASPPVEPEASVTVPPPPTPTPPSPAMTAPPTETPRQARHYTAETAAAEAARRARHSAPAEVDPGRRTPTLAT